MTRDLPLGGGWFRWGRRLLVELILPFVVVWATRQERRVLTSGVSLTPEECRDAHRLGIRHPESVRFLSVPTMPWPGARLGLNGVARVVGLRPDQTIGLTLGRGVFVHEDYWGDRRLVVHELAHVAQYERLGGLRPFLRQYLYQCLTVGYYDAPLEKEARAAECELGADGHGPDSAPA